MPEAHVNENPIRHLFTPTHVRGVRRTVCRLQGFREKPAGRLALLSTTFVPGSRIWGKFVGSASFHDFMQRNCKLHITSCLYLWHLFQLSSRRCAVALAVHQFIAASWSRRWVRHGELHGLRRFILLFQVRLPLPSIGFLCLVVYLFPHYTWNLSLSGWQTFMRGCFLTNARCLSGPIRTGLGLTGNHRI